MNSILELLAKKQQELNGIGDARSMPGIFSRGANVYNGTSLAAHSGGGVQYGRPPLQNAAGRRLLGKQNG